MRRDAISDGSQLLLTGKSLGSIAMPGQVVERAAPMRRIIGVSPWADYVRQTVFKLAAHRSSRADHRTERHGQGADCPGHPRAQSAGRWSAGAG